MGDVGAGGAVGTAGPAAGAAQSDAPAPGSLAAALPAAGAAPAGACCHGETAAGTATVAATAATAPPAAETTDPATTASSRENSVTPTSAAAARYAVEDLIGSGTYKSVFRAFDNESGVAVAWMELKKRHKMVHSERDQLRQEVALLKALRHPSLLTFHDVLELPEKTVLITELVTSGTLRQYLQRTGTPSLRVLQSWCQQLLRGLDYLHSRNPVVIHRDIKADNIFVDGTSGELKIGDMGLACLCHDGFASAVIGTPAFMAPEMLTEHYNEAVDIWAFGMTVLEMVTLEYPYEECSHDAQIFMRISNGLRPKSLRAVEDPRIHDFILCCIEPNVALRPTAKMLMGHAMLEVVEDLNWQKTRLELNAVDEDGTLQLRFVRATKEDEVNNIDFSFMPDEEAEDVASSMVEEGLINVCDVEAVVESIVQACDSLPVAEEDLPVIIPWSHPLPAYGEGDSFHLAAAGAAGAGNISNISNISIGDMGTPGSISAGRTANGTPQTPGGTPNPLGSSSLHGALGGLLASPSPSLLSAHHHHMLQQSLQQHSSPHAGLSHSQLLRSGGSRSCSAYSDSGVAYAPDQGPLPLQASPSPWPFSASGSAAAHAASTAALRSLLVAQARLAEAVQSQVPNVNSAALYTEVSRLLADQLAERAEAEQSARQLLQRQTKDLLYIRQLVLHGSEDDPDDLEFVSFDGSGSPSGAAPVAQDSTQAAATCPTTNSGGAPATIPGEGAQEQEVNMDMQQLTTMLRSMMGEVEANLTGRVEVPPAGAGGAVGLGGAPPAARITPVPRGGTRGASSSSSSSSTSRPAVPAVVGEGDVGLESAARLADLAAASPVAGTAAMSVASSCTHSVCDDVMSVASTMSTASSDEGSRGRSVAPPAGEDFSKPAAGLSGLARLPANAAAALLLPGSRGTAFSPTASWSPGSSAAPSSTASPQPFSGRLSFSPAAAAATIRAADTDRTAEMDNRAPAVTTSSNHQQ